jgi:hypothetical protein
MSFIITLYVREGIVMASDSRLTLNTTQVQDGQPHRHLAVGQSDSNYKTFLAPNNIGISTFGAADIQGVPIAGFIESFMSERLGQGNQEVDQVAELLLNYFRGIPEPPDTGFHIAGYKTNNDQRDQRIRRVIVRTNEIKQVNPVGQQGAVWDGERDILIRLVQPLWMQTEAGEYQPLPTCSVPWQFFTLQDALTTQYTQSDLL